MQENNRCLAKTEVDYNRKYYCCLRTAKESAKLSICVCTTFGLNNKVFSLVNIPSS